MEQLGQVLSTVENLVADQTGTLIVLGQYLVQQHAHPPDIYQCQPVLLRAQHIC